MCCITYYIRPDVVACGCVMRWAWRCVVFIPALVFLILYKVIYALRVKLCVMLYFVGLENRVTICKSIPIFNRNLVT